MAVYWAVSVMLHVSGPFGACLQLPHAVIGGAESDARVRIRQEGIRAWRVCSSLPVSGNLTNLPDAVLPGVDEIAQAPLRLKYLAPDTRQPWQVVGLW